jgi:molecular chaperone GrpE (heat shock protein)
VILNEHVLQIRDNVAENLVNEKACIEKEKARIEKEKARIEKEKARIEKEKARIEEISKDLETREEKINKYFAGKYIKYLIVYITFMFRYVSQGLLY